LQSISFEEIDSLQRIEKKKLFSFKPIGANLSCDENTFKTRNHQQTKLSILLISMPKKSER
jgi:hypothetical protein